MLTAGAAVGLLSDLPGPAAAAAGAAAGAAAEDVDGAAAVADELADETPAGNIFRCGFESRKVGFLSKWMID